MKLYADYHTHTVYSHGSGEIEDNVKVALERGLCQIGITDHGFKHTVFGLSEYRYRQMRSEVQRLKSIYPIDILLGVEANLTGLKGTIDITDEQYENIDIVVAGYHKATFPKAFSDIFKMHGAGIYRNLTGVSTAKMIARSTEAYVKAIEKNPIDILSHPNYVLGVEVGVVAEACASFGTYFELNGKRINMTRDEFERVLLTKVKFVANSDAHSPNRVGDILKVESYLAEYSDEVKNRVVNLTTPITLRSRGGK